VSISSAMPHCTSVCFQVSGNRAVGMKKCCYPEVLRAHFEQIALHSVFQTGVELDVLKRSSSLAKILE